MTQRNEELTDRTHTHIVSFIFSKNIFGDSENIFGENILGENFFGQNIFGPPITLPCPTYNHHLFTPPSSVIFKDECYGRTKDELTDRTHTRIVSFIVLDMYVFYSLSPLQRLLLRVHTHPAPGQSVVHSTL